MLLGTLSARLLGNLLRGKGVKQQNSSNVPAPGVMRTGEGTARVGQHFQWHLIFYLMLKFNGVYSRIYLK